LFTSRRHRGGAARRCERGDSADDHYYARARTDADCRHRRAVTADAGAAADHLPNTIVQRPVAAPPAAVKYHVGGRVPDSVQLYSIPESVGVEVPAVKTYKYMVVNNRVVLVDPATSQVVAAFAR